MQFVRTRCRDLEVPFFVLIDSKNTALYNFGNQNEAQNDYPIHQLQETQGVNWIVIGNDIVHDATNSYFEQIPQSDGSILLRLVDIFTDNSKNRNSRPEALPTQLDDEDYRG